MVRHLGLTLAGLLLCGLAPAADLADNFYSNVHQLTSGGENAEAYWSPDGKRLIFQSTRGALKCDQIFVMNADGSDQHMVSTGKGRTTCGYFLPDNEHILYASTHLAGDACPPEADHSKGYVWAVYPRLRHLHRQRRRQRSQAPDRRPRLRRRSHRQREDEEDHLHLDGFGRSGPLGDESRRLGEEADHQILRL